MCSMENVAWKMGTKQNELSSSLSTFYILLSTATEGSIL